jgi:hypothetical protein
MSAFYDQASLVVVPSGYKSGKIYAQKPLTTDGQLTFTRASTATRVNASGLIEEVASGVPRLDYTNSTCPKLLLEPQRSNIALRSETFESGTWGKSLVTITANYDTAPNGTLTADRFVSAGGAFPQIAQVITVVSGTQYTVSLYVKSDGTTQRPQAILIGGNILTFTPTSTWQRLTTTFTAASSSATFVLATNSATSPASSFVIWGAQVEAGAYATSYIPTTTAAVTRLADAASKTGISSLIGQTEGTIFIDFEYNQTPPDVNGRLLQLWGTSEVTNSILPLIFGAGANANRFQLTTFSAGSSNIPIVQSAGTTVPFGRQKFAIAYTAGVYTVYRNGSLFASGSGLAPVSLTALDLGGSASFDRNFGNPINQALLFKTRLPNSDLATLTSL